MEIGDDSFYQFELIAGNNDDLCRRYQFVGTSAIEVGEDTYLSDMPVDALRLFSEPLAASSIADEQPYIVDRAWADHAYDVLDREGLLG